MMKLLTWALAVSLALVIFWSLFRRWVKKVSFVRIDVVYKNPQYKGRPTATVAAGFWFLYEHVETFVCYQVNMVGADWISVDSGKALSMFDPLYAKINNEARKAQIEWENK